jgi:hypothetical protein
MIVEALRDAELHNPPLWVELQELFVSGSPRPKVEDSPLPAVIIRIILQIVPSIAAIFSDRLLCPFRSRSAT